MRDWSFSAQVISEQPGESSTAVDFGERKLVAEHGRMVDQPADFRITSEHILAPHCKRTEQRISGCQMAPI